MSGWSNGTTTLCRQCLESHEPGREHTTVSIRLIDTGPCATIRYHVAQRVNGPNAFVTERWRSRMKPNEILLVEEIEHFGYDFLYWKPRERKLARLYSALWRPLKGELPTPRWIVEGLSVGVRDFLDSLFYMATFPVFYVTVRLVFVRLIREGEIFDVGGTDAG